jgi:hypothetical protein
MSHGIKSAILERKSAIFKKKRDVNRKLTGKKNGQPKWFRKMVAS